MGHPARPRSRPPMRRGRAKFSGPAVSHCTQKGVNTTREVTQIRLDHADRLVGSQVPTILRIAGLLGWFIFWYRSADSQANSRSDTSKKRILNLADVTEAMSFFPPLPCV